MTFLERLKQELWEFVDLFPENVNLMSSWSDCLMLTLHTAHNIFIENVNGNYTFRLFKGERCLVTVYSSDEKHLRGEVTRYVRDILTGHYGNK